MKPIDRATALAGAQWSQRLDPSDPRFVLITARIPTNPSSPHEAVTDVGEPASRRMFRFCLAMLAGAGLLDNAAAYRLHQALRDPEPPAGAS